MTAKTTDSTYYTSADLRSFASTLDAVYADLLKAEDYPLETGVTDVLRRRIAGEIFRCASVGERDPERLQRQVLAKFWTPRNRSRSGEGRRPGGSA